MDNNKKKKILWLAIIILVIAGLIWFALSLFNNRAAPNEDIYSTDNQPRFETNSPTFNEPATISPEDSTEFTVKNLSRTFTERFGSWSTDNPGQNLSDLNSIVSASFKQELNALVSYQERDFYGVTTKAVSTKINYLDEEGGEAEVLVNTQRVVTDENLNQNTEYQAIVVSLVASGNNWLVNQAEWR